MNAFRPDIIAIVIIALLLVIWWTVYEIKNAITKPTQPGKDRHKIIGDFKFMYIVKADNPDVGYAVSYSVTDSEGNAVPVEETVAEITSTDESVVSVNTTDQTVRFGAPGVASVNVRVFDKDADFEGDPLGSFGAQFTVVAGEPAAVSGGSIQFSGLTEAPVEP